VIIVGLSFLLAGWLVEFFAIEPALVGPFQWAFWILAIRAAIAFPSSVLGATLMGHEKYVPANLVNVTLALVRAILTVVLLRRGMGLLGVAYSQLGVGLVAISARFVLCRWLIPYLRINIGLAKWAVAKTLLTYGMSTMAIVVADQLRFNVDTVVIGKLLGMPKIAVYAVALHVVRWLPKMIMSGMHVIRPRFTALDGAGRTEELKRLFVQSLSIAAVMTFGISMLAVVFGGKFITRWVGEGFFGAVPVLWILVVAFMTDLAQNPGLALMYALSKHHFYAVASIIEGIANVTISILLAPRYGIVGVAMGTAISMMAFRIFVQPIYVSRIAGISLGQYFKPFAIPAAVAGAMTVAAWYMEIVTSWERASYISLVWQGLVAGVIFLGIVWVISAKVGMPIVLKKAQ